MKVTDVLDDFTKVFELNLSEIFMKTIVLQRESGPNGTKWPTLKWIWPKLDVRTTFSEPKWILIGLNDKCWVQTINIWFDECVLRQGWWMNRHWFTFSSVYEKNLWIRWKRYVPFTLDPLYKEQNFLHFSLRTKSQNNNTPMTPYTQVLMHLIHLCPSSVQKREKSEKKTLIC